MRGTVLPRDALDGGSSWALLPPPPPQPTLERGHGALVGDSRGRGQPWSGTAVVPWTGNIYQGGYFKDASELRQ